MIKRSEPFDRIRWQLGADDTSTNNPRLRMINQIEPIIQIGETKTVLREIFGKPDMAEDRCEIYLLGISEWQVNFTALRLFYDHSDRLEHFAVTRI